MSLDTKYRPRNFDDVLGQDGIITILRRYIVTGRSLHQSYLFAGPFGSGKCVVGDTLVSTDRGLVPIRNLMGPNLIDPIDVGVRQEGGVNGKAAFTYRGGVKDTVRIQTRRGYVLEGTPNHRIRVMHPDGTVGWECLGNIQDGSVSCIVQNGFFGSGADLSGFHYDAPKGGNNQFTSILWDSPGTLTPEWGRLIGYLIGDGSCKDTQAISISCAEHDVKMDQLSLLKTLTGSAHETPDKRSASGLSNLRSSRKQVRMFLAYAGVGYHGAVDKEIPWAILASPKKVVAEFLRGYFESDGYVSDSSLSATTKSVRLSEQLQVMLLQFGIPSRRTFKKHPKYGGHWTVTLMAKGWHIFARDIGFVSARKSALLLNLVSSDRSHGLKRKLTNVREVIPFQKSWVQRFYQGLPKDLHSNRTDQLFQCRYGKNQCTTRQVASIANDYRDYDPDNHFCDLVSYDYLYDPVVQIKYGQAEVFDLNVPEGEMFAANGFMNHNTTLGRIMARALMCESPKANGDPCDACPSCVSILETGNSMDFIEVDAATNSGKADVQKITEEIQYSTFAGRRRIYLFDEAHQLSRDALDALLKPLEENIPGTQEKRLVCIFCTTEPEKMKATIFSRCAPTFVIQPVVPSDIAKRLAYVCDQEGFEYDMDMLQVIAEMTECHIRDALKSVEGVSMLGKLDRENVAKYLKLDMNLMFIDTLENLGKDLGKAIGFAKEAMLRSSPATCYEKLASLSMMAYQVGIGALKAPSYIESGRFERLFASQQHSLIGFASRFSSRVGRPTESMLLCDLGALHYGGSAIGNAQIVMVQNSPSTNSMVPATVNRPGQVMGKVIPSPNGVAIQKADVRPNPKAIGGYQPPPLEHLNGVKGSTSEMEPAMFGFLLAMQIAQYEGMPSGPTGRSDMGGH